MSEKIYISETAQHACAIYPGEANLQCFTRSKPADTLHKQRGAELTESWM